MTAVSDEPGGKPQAAPKGRPTPSRKEAEAARKAALKSGPIKKPTTKAEKVAARELERERRAKARAGMMAGDERYLPERDKGPVRKYVRDWVDSRRSVLEFFLYVAIVVLIMGLVPNARLQGLIITVWMLLLVVIVLEGALILFRLNRDLKNKWPEKSDRRGVNLYALMRTMQIRKLRIPPPRFKAGGKPVEPKS